MRALPLRALRRDVPRPPCVRHRIAARHAIDNYSGPSYFLTLSGIGTAGLLLPKTRLIAAKQLLTPNDVEGRQGFV
ncbi:hypothetical protein BJD12_01915 [Xanthomonas vesicatoria ATCC 35937]|uniref:Uncharacterized protein n=1 Tax=Xanthomonas vesicatoria ATCC 35937 TaxID=925775 RepID=F0BCU7_9XANT|nr:hypothetical protein [Xanthomonas vesicatoria]APP74219.1 hypothetical protein BJD12_01915 [Xanthomonas vesicatoria ATCC 35937]EGD09764.1 hypothetical protein XVE_1926 [Xanthomonas vesicatoria ATCC 35937]KTF34220.1 hypothetical protein LMG920_06940 [Xanthomonas vesicatoria]MCC8598030.1 hypothetical protein [Xanthomonas vesicatoria]MCC8605883.1 hypothetical protein [Xanthomonas vesicatoria]